MLQNGDVVLAPFGRGVRTYRVQVGIVDVTLHSATLLAKDGSTHGPARLVTLTRLNHLTREDTELWQALFAAHARIDAAAYAEINAVDDPGDAPQVQMLLLPCVLMSCFKCTQPHVQVDAQVDDLPPPPVLPYANIDAEQIANPDEPAAPQAQAHCVPQPPLHRLAGVVCSAQAEDIIDEYAFQEDNDPRCDDDTCYICLVEKGRPTCNSGCVFCDDCLFTYGKMKLEGAPCTSSPDCTVCVDGAISWQMLASRWPTAEYAIFDRLIAHYAEPRAQNTTIEDSVDSQCGRLLHAARNEIVNTQNLQAPCCGAVFVDFNDCFALQCHVCQHYFCAWCVEWHSPDWHMAHDHVRACACNPHAGAVYGNMDLWEENVARRKRARLGRMQRDLDAKVRTLAALVGGLSAQVVNLDP